VNIETFAHLFATIRTEVAKVIVGQDEIIDHALVAVLAGGHVLLEGAPGLGKTLLVRTLARVVGCGFKRIQFTPDLMPSDVTGGNVFNAKKDGFEFFPGPIFTQLLLADEINRAPAKTQSALLEGMQERAVSSDGVTRKLPRPFFVIATQNPVESQGTYPLPEAQLDRFLFKINIQHPPRAAEKTLLMHYLNGFDPTELERFDIREVASAEGLLSMQSALSQVRVESEVLDYITDIVGRTRTHRSIQLGASPRASIALLSAARSLAASQTRDFVIPDDVKALAPSVLRHRIMLHPDAEIEGVSPDQCITGILREATVPKTAAA
jgi:MoxR-like ATPase